MALQDSVVLNSYNREERFVFNENEFDWSNVIEIDENTYAKLTLIGNSSSRLYLDGINILLNEAEAESELEQNVANKYYLDDEGAYVNFNQKEIVLFEINNPLFKENFMDHTLYPGYYRLMVVNSQNEKFFSWLKVNPKQIGEKQLESLKNDLENTIQGLARRFDRNDNGFLSSEKGITQRDLELIELFHNEINQFEKTIYYITNNPRYEIKNEYLWTERMISPLDYKGTIKKSGSFNKNRKYFSKCRCINYNLRINKILGSQLTFLLKKVDHLIRVITNYNFPDKESASSFLLELKILKKYRYLIVNFFDNSWIQSVNYQEQVKLTNDNIYDNNYLYINKLIRKMKSLIDKEYSFSRQYKYYYHRTDVLYEVWAYVKVIETLKKIGFVPKNGWIFSGEREGLGELREGETVISEFDSRNSELDNKNCKYIKIVYDKPIINRDNESPVKMALGYTHKRPDIRIEFYDMKNKIISLVIMDTKYRNYNSIFYSKGKNHTLKQFIEYVNGIEIKESYKSDSIKKMEEITGQTSLKNSLFILYPKFNENRNKPKVEGEDNQYRINLIPNDENKDLYIYLKKQIKQMNNYFNYVD